MEYCGVSLSNVEEVAIARLFSESFLIFSNLIWPRVEFLTVFWTFFRFFQLIHVKSYMIIDACVMIFSRQDYVYWFK